MAATTVNLCIEVVAMQSSTDRGTPAQWAVAAWATGGNVPHTTLRLQASPSSSGTPRFSFGCGSHDGSSSCDLGSVDASSAQRQLEAQVTVPVSQKSVTSVTLTVTASATGLKADPKMSASVTIVTPPTPGSSTTPTQTPVGISTLPAVGLPLIPTPSALLSPGGNASGLFPALSPSAGSNASSSSTPSTARARQVADTSALPEGTDPLGAQLIGLGALAVAFVLAVTRLSIRRSARTVPDSTSPLPKTPSEAAAETKDAENPPSDAGTDKPNE